MFRATRWRAQLQSSLSALAEDPTALSIFRDDATWVIPGRSEIAGLYRGKTEIAEALAQLGELSAGTFRLEVGSPDMLLRHAHLVGRVRARRDGRVLDQGVAIEVDLSGSGVRQARLVPDDQRLFDEFWGIPAPALSPADHDALARAIRRVGTDGSLGWLARLAVAIVAASALLWFVTVLQTWRPSSSLSISSHNAAATRRIAATGRNSEAEVAWMLEGATAGALEIQGPGSQTVEVVLPVSTGDACRALASLGSPVCDATIPPPVTIRWPTAVVVTNTQVGTAARVDILSVAATRGRGGWVVEVLAQGGDPPSICFRSPMSGLDIQIAGSGETATMEALGPTALCDDGFHLSVGGGGGSVRPSLEFHRVEGLELTGSGPQVSLDGLNGSLVLEPGDAHVVTTRGEVALAASAAEPAAFRLSAGRGDGRLESTGRVMSVLTDEGELVPSEWERHPWLWGPLIGGLVTFAIVTPLTTAVRTATELFGRFDVEQWLVRRWRRRLRSSPGSPEGGEDEP